MNRVVVTGMGIISPIGNDTKTFWNNLVSGACGIDKITRFDTSDYAVKVAAEIKDFDAKKYYDTPAEIRHSDLVMQYAVAAAQEAYTDSAITDSNMDPTRLGVYIGSGIGGMNTFMEEYKNLLDKGPGRVSPFFIPKLITNMATGAVSIRFNAQGPTLPVVTACATSTNTLGEAFHAIKHGYADAILAGGSESTINELSIAGFTSCKALSTSEDPNAASLPFDARRGGFVMGEGAAVLVLEEYEHAKKRNAKIYAEVCGYGNTADAYHITAPHPEGIGAIRAIKLAKEEGNINCAPENIYFNAHGTGTSMNDKMETAAIKEVFGADAAKLNISSTKSMTGHMLGATGAAEAMASILALKEGIVPPTIHYQEKDPSCDLNYTPNKAVKADLKFAMSTSLGFGGHNGCIAFKAMD